MADSKDKLRPGITETRGAGSGSLLSGNLKWVLIGLVILMIVGYANGFLKVGPFSIKG